MIWLAQLGMAGRFQSLMIVMISVSSTLFAWLGASLIGLVTLRKGASEGAFLLFWAMLPAIFLSMRIGDINPLAQLVGTFFLATILRRTVNLSFTMLAALPIGLLFGTLLLWLSPSMIDHVVGVFTELIASLKEQMENAGQIVMLETPGESLVVGMIGVANLAATMLCLILARFWQASLYNPGGFGKEFRALSFSPTMAFPLAMGFVLMANLDGYQSWAGFFGLPLTVTGIALVHAKAQDWTSPLLGLCLFYVIWLIVDLVKLLLLLLSLIDSVYDFRSKWSGAANSSDKRRDDESDDV